MKTPILPLTVFLSGIGLSTGAHADVDTHPDTWWRNLSALCGQAFAGELKRAPEGDTSFQGQHLIMHVRDCTDQRIRIPFMVGDDRSRTWVLTHHDGRIELKHDHRHHDGSPDAITWYGGIASNTGDAVTQVFPADEHTRDVIAGSGLRSVWLIDIEPGERFSYGAQRLGTERAFRIDFNLSQPVEPPPAPWGWTED